MKHSKITAIVLALCMLVTLMIVPAVAAENLVPDGSFETWGSTGEKGDAWELVAPDNGSTNLVALNTTEVSDGSYSMQMKSLEVSSGQKGIFVNIGSFEKGTTVKVSVKVNSKVASTGRLIVRLEDTGGLVNNSTVGEAFPIQNVSAVTDGWQVLTTQSTMDNFTAGKALFVGFETYSSEFEFYVDEFSAEVVVDDEEEEDNNNNYDEITPGENLLTDGSFETWGATNEPGSWMRNLPNAEVTTIPNDMEVADGTWSMRLAGAAVTGTGRQGIYQNIGRFPEGTILKVSYKYYIKTLEGTTKPGNDPCYRLIVRREDGNSTPLFLTEAYSYGTTDGWQEHSVQGAISKASSECDIVVWFEEWYAQDLEIYLDDFKAEVVVEEDDDEEEVVVKPTIANGDFENGLDGWSRPGASNITEVVEDSNGNHYAELTQNWNHRLVQKITGLTPGTKYMIRFDICSNGKWILIDDEGARTSFMNYSTNGEWEPHRFVWIAATEDDPNTAYNDTTERVFRILFNNGGQEVPEGAYVRIDNVVLEEVDPGVVNNGSFEYGINGLGEVYSEEAGNIVSDDVKWQTLSGASEGTYTKVKGGIDGTYALKITEPNSDAKGYARIKHNTITVEQGALYELSAYVKNVSLTGSDAYAMLHSDFATNLKLVEADLPVGEWVCLRIPYIATGTGDNPWLAVDGTGVLLIDNFSLRKVTGPVVTYEKADGGISENLVDGGKATIIMPAAAGDAGNAVALAVYSEAEGTKTLKSLTMKMITAGEVTAGYASFTLTAESLGDFASANYIAKIMTMKNGLLVPLHDVILYTEAQ